MNYRGREGITYITTACNLGQEVNYKLFTLCKISRQRENQSSLPLSVWGGGGYSKIRMGRREGW